MSSVGHSLVSEVQMDESTILLERAEIYLVSKSLSAVYTPLTPGTISSTITTLILSPSSSPAASIY